MATHMSSSSSFIACWVLGACLQNRTKIHDSCILIQFCWPTQSTHPCHPWPVHLSHPLGPPRRLLGIDMDASAWGGIILNEIWLDGTTDKEKRVPQDGKVGRNCWHSRKRRGISNWTWQQESFSCSWSMVAWLWLCGQKVKQSVG